LGRFSPDEKKWHPADWEKSLSFAIPKLKE
jgi:hypothetical protein